MNYRLGSMLPGDVRTVYMPTCVNQTTEPQIEQDVTRAILSQIQTDGTLRVAPELEADSILSVTITDFS
ncbi:MAG TPA: LPS assembly lipoprotein LptE, partial [Kiritimatiellia bacterium]|nr:LPS assembly lipoprotein LptE [Kiritimatiellia bacterium]